MVHADHVNITGESVYTVEKNTESLIVTISRLVISGC